MSIQKRLSDNVAIEAAIRKAFRRLENTENAKIYALRDDENIYFEDHGFGIVENIYAYNIERPETYKGKLPDDFHARLQSDIELSVLNRGLVNLECKYTVSQSYEQLMRYSHIVAGCVETWDCKNAIAKDVVIVVANDSIVDGIADLERCLMYEVAFSREHWVKRTNVKGTDTLVNYYCPRDFVLTGQDLIDFFCPRVKLGELKKVSREPYKLQKQDRNYLHGQSNARGTLNYLGNASDRSDKNTVLCHNAEDLQRTYELAMEQLQGKQLSLFD